MWAAILIVFVFNVVIPKDEDQIQSRESLSSNQDLVGPSNPRPETGPNEFQKEDRKEKKNPTAPLVLDPDQLQNLQYQEELESIRGQ